MERPFTTSIVEPLRPRVSQLEAVAIAHCRGNLVGIESGSWRRRMPPTMDFNEYDNQEGQDHQRGQEANHDANQKVRTPRGHLR